MTEVDDAVRKPASDGLRGEVGQRRGEYAVVVVDRNRSGEVEAVHELRALLAIHRHGQTERQPRPADNRVPPRCRTPASIASKHRGISASSSMNNVSPEM